MKYLLDCKKNSDYKKADAFEGGDFTFCKGRSPGQ